MLVDTILHRRPREIGEQFLRESQAYNDMGSRMANANAQLSEDLASSGAKDVKIGVERSDKDAVVFNNDIVE
jgi:hypothetical protein